MSRCVLVSDSRPLDRPQETLTYGHGVALSVSVVIPTLNAERFLKQSLESALSQAAVGCEVVVVDGGSRDATIAIAESFGELVRIVVEPGLRQAAAVNRGVLEATAPLILVLSGDDILLPGALATLARELDEHPESDVVYGEADFIDASGLLIGQYPGGPYDANRFETGCFVPHAAAVVRRVAFRAVGGLDESLEFAFDFDFWVRLSRRTVFRKIDDRVAAIRMHPATKTLGSRMPAYREAFAVFKKYYGYIPYPWMFAYVNYVLDRGDQFFDPLRKKRRSMLLALPVGCVLNFPKVLRFARDWLAARKIGAFMQ